VSILSQPFFHDEAAAFVFLESILWSDGPICPHCGVVGDKIYRITANPAKRVRHGLHKCGHCHKQFTAKVGTVFEQMRIPLHKCLQAVYLMASSKKGISSNQLARTLEIQVNSAWFLSHRIREAMRDGMLAPMGGNGGVVEVDETFIGNDRAKKPKGQKKGRGGDHKFKVLSLVDRETGAARSIVVDDLKTGTLLPILQKNIDRETRIMTDEAGQYRWLHIHTDFKEHGVVRHGQDEYVSKEDPSIYTNTVEGFFSIFKRGMKGIYQHCSEKHLHRYLAEFDFRYSNRKALGIEDAARAEQALRGVVGKRLTYRQSSNS
jgi:transposase-like protein